MSFPIPFTEMKSTTQLQDFMKYCANHPDERFWQALRNWSEFGYILASHTNPDEDLQDTFYWEEKNK